MDEPKHSPLETLINTREYLIIRANEKIRPKYKQGWQRMCWHQRTFHNRYSSVMLDETLSHDEKAQFLYKYFDQLMKYNEDFPKPATDDQLFPKIPNLQSLKITMGSQTEFYNASNETPPGERYYEKVDTIE
ncbi:unnamed protein product [Rotaria magnacalcarata]|uniref:Uncharacterized protein n=1 Tax=Rotaria magnacalcarata TaxID=392030 RepID=A0A816V8J6_9BILA|nr:unnamed protein product [Rotaria magnacalcarata]CAF4377033.1 unnamed protein product [Rotaria magnacalcarata]